MMVNLISPDVSEDKISKYSIDLLNILLYDRTTRQNIVWATDNYLGLGEEYAANRPIQPEQITGEHALLIQPRISKSKEVQESRTRDKAEVFTPSWVCNAQNNLIDNAWFDRTDVFNTEGQRSWTATTEKIMFPEIGKTWKKYVDDKRLEMTCGEAPYLVSRYDTVSGEQIAPWNRIGMLDRKLRIVNENTETEEEWCTWAQRAFEATYAFEFQGDNLLIARENCLATYIDYYSERFRKMPGIKLLKNIARIISWNVWQMDGLNYAVPYSQREVCVGQTSLFGEEERELQWTYCKITDWRDKSSLLFKDMIKGEK